MNKSHIPHNKGVHSQASNKKISKIPPTDHSIIIRIRNIREISKSTEMINRRGRETGSSNKTRKTTILTIRKAIIGNTDF